MQSICKCVSKRVSKNVSKCLIFDDIKIISFSSYDAYDMREDI